MNKNKYIVYKHTSPSNKVYIGITSKNVQERSGFNGNHYKRNKYFYSAIQKYGWDNFKHEILCSGLTEEEASEKEKYYIEYYKSNDAQYGYNLTTGGELHYVLNEEVKKRISSLTSNQWKNAAIRQKMIESLKESHKGPLSIKQIEAHIKRRGTKLSEETKLKLKGHVPWNKGKTGLLSKEALHKMSVARMGKPPGNKGTHLSEEQKTFVSIRTKEGMSDPIVKQKIKDSNKRRTGIIFKFYIYQYDLEGNLLAIHKGEANASRATGIDKSGIHNCVCGKTKTCGGFIWKRVNKENYNEKNV